MTEQEYVRKYMLKDIVKRNLKFIWLIVLCAVLFAAGLGYKKYDEYQKRFYKIALKGTVNQYSVEYYSGNVKGETLSIRTQSLIGVMTSRETYNELVKLSGYPLTYETFLELVICDTDGTKDLVSATLQYPYGSDEYSVVEDSQALAYMNHYTQAVENVCGRVIGEGSVYLLGRSDISSVTYEATDEQKSTARKAVIKNAFIGGVIGFIIPVVIITLLYLISGKLRTAQEIAYCAGLKLLACVKKDNTGELNQAVLYISKYFENTPVRINLINIGTGGEYIAEELAKCFEQAGGIKAEIQNTAVSEGSIDAYKTAMDCNVNILVAGAGKVKEEDISKVLRTMSLYDIEGNGVIVYEPVK